MGGVVDMITGKSGDKAADASIRASEITAAGQTEALDYLKETERLPQQYREGALGQLAGLYGLPGGEGDQQQFIDRAMNSPLYQQLTGNLERGEEAILRNQSATGGLRSGNTQYNLADYATQLENDALLQSYNQQLQGVQGLAGTPSMAPQIAQMTAAPSATIGQGITAGAQAQQQGDQDLVNSLLMGGAIAFSDIRLKDNIKHIGEKNGHAWFEWEWNDKAKELGLKGRDEGVMAHFVAETHPDAIFVHDGHLMVDYEYLGVA